MDKFLKTIGANKISSNLKEGDDIELNGCSSLCVHRDLDGVLIQTRPMSVEEAIKFYDIVEKALEKEYVLDPRNSIIPGGKKYVVLDGGRILAKLDDNFGGVAFFVYDRCNAEDLFNRINIINYGK